MSVLALAAGAVAGSLVTAKKGSKKSKYYKERTDKFYNYFQLLNYWLKQKNEGKSLEEYFIKNHYKDIAIYGIGEIGNRLYEELKGSDINIKYVIDKKTDGLVTDLKVCDPDEKLEEVDVIVITPIFDYNRVEEKLMNKVDCDIISIEDVVYEA